MKKRLTYKEIADMLGKNEQTIKGWKSRFPELLEIVQLGALCKANNINSNTIVKLTEIIEVIKQSEV